MNLNKEEYKKLIKEIKKDIIDNAKAGGYKQRHRLLCYGFLRGIPYRQIEAKINEDKFELSGQNAFKAGLTYSICFYLQEKGILEKGQTDPFYEDILNWLKVSVVSKINTESVNDEKYRVWPPKLDSEPLTEEQILLCIEALCEK